MEIDAHGKLFLQRIVREDYRICDKAKRRLKKERDKNK